MPSLARAAGLLAAVLVVALFLAAAIVRLPVIQRWAAALVLERLPAGVGIEGAAFTLLPPGVRLTNVSLAADGPTIASVSCRVRLLALLAGRVELAAIVVHGATLAIERSAAGDLQLAGPLAGLLGTAADGAAPAGAPGAGLSLHALPAVTVADASVSFVDHLGHGGSHTLSFDGVRLTLDAAGEGSVRFTLAAHLDPNGQLSAHGSVSEVAAADGRPADHALDLTLTARGLDAYTMLSYVAAIVPGGGTARAQGGLDGSLTLSGTLGGDLAGDATLAQPSGSMLWDEVSIGAPVEISAHISTAGEAVTLSNGQLTVAHLAAARIAASDLRASFAVAERMLHLTSVTATAYGGKWTQTGSVTLADPPSVNVTLRAEDVHCAELLTAVTGEHPNYGCELFNAEAAVHGVWTGADSVAEDVEGSGHVEMRGGTIPSSSIIGAMWQALVPLIAVGREPDHIGAPTRVDHLTESFALRAGSMHTDDLTLVTDDYTVTGTGSISLDGAVDLDTRVALTPAGVTKLLTMAALPIPGELPTLPAIPTSITGTLGSPTIRPEVADLPLAVAQGLFSGLRGVGEALTDTAGRGLRSLTEGLKKTLTDR